MKKYDPTIVITDPTVSIKMPKQILRDLVKRSEENGHSVELELAIRLARSLERDQEMIAQDNQEAFKAFNINKNSPTIMVSSQNHKGI